MSQTTPIRIVSADCHINEPPHVFDAVPEALRDRVPKMLRSADGGDGWSVDGSPPKHTFGVEATAGRAGGAKKVSGLRFDEILPGNYEPEAHVEDMARDGVDVSIVYPAFAVQAYVQPDRELGLACMRSYNDWILGEFQGGAPDHIVGLPMLPVDDGMKACVAELERCLVAGARGGFLPGFPTRPYHDRYYDPLFARAAEAGLPLSVHRTFGGRPTHANWDAVMGLEFSAGTTVYGFFSAVRTFTYLLYSGVFERHPRLKFVAAEVNFGWLPFWLQSMEQTFEIRTRMGDESIRTTRRPVEYLGENLFVTVLDDKFGFDLVPDHPWLANCALWSSDYPHSVTLWPDSRKHLGELAAGLSDDQVSRIASGNAERVYGV